MFELHFSLLKMLYINVKYASLHAPRAKINFIFELQKDMGGMLLLFKELNNHFVCGRFKTGTILLMFELSFPPLIRTPTFLTREILSFSMSTLYVVL